MQTPAKQALICWLSASVLILATIDMMLDAPASPDATGAAIGQVIAQTGAPAVIVWWLARRRNPFWSWLQFGSVYLIVIIGFSLLAAVGRVSAEESPPFVATFSSAWSVDRLASASSDSERGPGRLRAATRAGVVPLAGAAMIEIMFVASMTRRSKLPEACRKRWWSTVRIEQERSGRWGQAIANVFDECIGLLSSDL